MTSGIIRLVLLTIVVAGVARAAEPGPGAHTEQLSKTWPQNDLERLLVAAAMDHSKSPEFIRGLLNSDICALTDKPLTVTTDGTNAREKIALVGVKAPDGQPATPIFTSRQRGTGVFGEAAIVVCGKAEVFLNAVRGSRVVVDPGQPFGIFYSAEDLDHILGVESTATKSDFTLRQPTDAPAPMIRQLTAALESEPRVTGAWLSLAYWPEKKEWSWYLVVQTSLDEVSIQRIIRDSAREIDMLGRPLDIAINISIDDPKMGTFLIKQ
jgi:hypothetical protein